MKTKSKAEIERMYNMNDVDGIKILLTVLLIIRFLSMNAFAESNVTEITIVTDSSWKVIDAKVDGWTSINFDDSYWLVPIIGDSYSGWIGARGLKYPEKPSSHPYFFRKTFELNGIEIMSGKLYYDLALNVGYSSPDITIYVNDNNVGSGTPNDITQYLKIGKNVIAAEDPNSEVFWLIAKIRVVTGSAPSPSPTVTSTITLTPTATPTPTPTPSISVTIPSPTATPAPTTDSITISKTQVIQIAALIIALPACIFYILRIRGKIK